LHTWPSTPVHSVAPTFGCEQVPIVAPWATLQIPPQHSAS
jgi:hypothetical protein